MGLSGQKPSLPTFSVLAAGTAPQRMLIAQPSLPMVRKALATLQVLMLCCAYGCSPTGGACPRPTSRS